jgi:hypothetical protein
VGETWGDRSREREVVRGWRRSHSTGGHEALKSARKGVRPPEPWGGAALPLLTLAHELILDLCYFRLLSCWQFVPAGTNKHGVRCVSRSSYEDLWGEGAAILRWGPGALATGAAQIPIPPQTGPSPSPPRAQFLLSKMKTEVIVCKFC